MPKNLFSVLFLEYALNSKGCVETCGQADPVEGGNFVFEKPVK